MDEDSGMLSKMLFLLMILVKTSLRRMRPSFDMAHHIKKFKAWQKLCFWSVNVLSDYKIFKLKKDVARFVGSFFRNRFGKFSSCVATWDEKSNEFFFFPIMTMKKMFKCCNVMWSVFNDPFLVLANIETNGLCQQGRYIRRTDLS